MTTSPPDSATANDRRFALVSDRVVTPEGVRAAALLVRGGQIEAILPPEPAPAGVVIEDLSGLVISPGLVDAHVHINEPGRTEWEGFETATRAAAAGGVTTLVDMPLNSSPVTTTADALDAKQAAARGKCHVDLGFHGGLVSERFADVEALIDAGVCGVKAFLCDSGLEEFPGVGEPQLRAALPLLARRGVPLLVHAEIVADGAAPGPIRSYGDWVRVRPAEFESRAIALMLRLCREFRAAVHVVHLATGPETETFAAAQRAGLPFTAETCPHYLHFAADELADADVRYKCAPPIRGREDRQQLWQGLLGGAIRTIGSDHSPCPPVMKRTADGDWRQAWGGISSLQLTLPIVWTGAASRGATLAQVAQWTATHPAELCGLPRKGRLAAGCDADLCVWDPDERWTIVGAELHHRHKLTPYDGQTVQGRVTRTYVRGQLAYDGGSFPAGPIGALLRRG